MREGRFFDRANEKLNQLARFETNELVPVNLQAIAVALAAETGEERPGTNATARPLDGTGDNRHE
jgi:hypothetical protein